MSPEGPLTFICESNIFIGGLMPQMVGWRYYGKVGAGYICLHVCIQYGFYVDERFFLR